MKIHVDLKPSALRALNMPILHLNADRKLKHREKSLPSEIHKFKPINLLFLLYRTPITTLSPLLPKLRYVTKDKIF